MQRGLRVSSMKGKHEHVASALGHTYPDEFDYLAGIVRHR